MPNYIHAKPKERITVDSVDDMIRSLSPDWVKTLTVYLFYFGVRISEALVCTSGDFNVYQDPDGQELLEVYSLTLKNKTRTSRRLYIPLATKYIDALLYYVKHQPQEKVWPYSRQYARVMIQKILPTVSPHCFRHNRLDYFAQRDESDFNLQSWAGWSDTRPAKDYTQAVDVKKMAKRHFS